MANEVIYNETCRACPEHSTKTSDTYCTCSGSCTYSITAPTTTCTVHYSSTYSNKTSIECQCVNGNTSGTSGHCGK
jgi:hypothetical protein